MTTSTILSILFVLELVIVGFGLAAFLFLKLRKLKREVAAKNAALAEKSESTDHDIFERKITQTRYKIAEDDTGDPEQDYAARNTLLKQRIEYLQLEKELLDESADNNNFWGNIFTRLSAIFAASQSNDADVKDGDTAQNSSSLHRRLSKYKKLLGKIIQEFRDYRNQAKKLAESIVNQSDDAKQSAAIKQSIEEFNKHDEQTRLRLESYQQEIDSDTDSAKSEPLSTSSQKHNIDFTPAKASEAEIKRLQEIIGRQYDSLDQLKHALLTGDIEDGGELHKKLEMVEKSQKELQTCVEVLEMENQRLSEELANAQQQLDAGNNGELEALHSRNTDLEEQLSESRSKLQSLEKDYNSLQQEFMRIYEKNKE